MHSWCCIFSPSRCVKVGLLHLQQICEFNTLCIHTCFWAYCTCVCTWGRVEELYTYMRVCVCVNSGIVSSFIMFGYMHECRLVSIVVTCMSYRLGRVYFISKDEREMLTDYCMRCEILVDYANNCQVVVHAYVSLSSKVSCLKKHVLSTCLVNHRLTH